MPYKWNDNAEAEGQQQAEKMPAGLHTVKIAKILHGSKGESFASRNGDPQILLVFTDGVGREAAQMVTLSERAGWVLAKIMAAFDPPANLARMETDGVEPAHFMDPAFADRILLNRKLDVEIEYVTGKDGKEYPNVTPVRQAARATALAAPATDDDAPPPAVDSDDPPPPVLGITNRDQAWAAVKQEWSTSTAPADKDRRNMQWTESIKQIGKPESQFTPGDWTNVAKVACIPF